MDANLVANYLTALKNKNKLTYDTIAKNCGKSESTVKNLCVGKSEDPRLDTVAPVVYAMGGSMDEMLNPGKSKDTLKEVSVVSLKESYEFQLAAMKDTNEAHIANIRAHYEQHIAELKEHYEHRVADKREIIAATKGANIFLTVLSAVSLIILVGLLIIEVMHPELGWIRF